MTPAEIRKARDRLGLSLAQMARMLGYQGKHLQTQMRHLESGRHKFMPCQRRLMTAYLSGYRPEDWPHN